MKNNKPVRIRLLRDRALTFSPRGPWALLSRIPKNAKENAGGAAGGVWGGMPPRPPHCDVLSPFSGDSEFFANLCPHQESNLDHELRRLVFYPLNYGSERSEYGSQSNLCAREDSNLHALMGATTSR